MIQFALDIAMLGLFVGKSGPAARAPVDDVLTPVNKSVVVQLYEYVTHGF
jgi:hypothetical protein